MDESTSVERWLPIPDEDGYEASDLGRIRSLNRVVVDRIGRAHPFKGKLLIPQPSGPSGHEHFVVTLAGQRRKWVHRLVLITFVGPCPPGMEGCHNDGNPANNQLDNLRWDTHSGNLLDQAEHGTNAQLNKAVCPRGHRLVSPNLVLAGSVKGYRQCLTCNRTMADRACAKSQGWPFDFEASMNEHYARIMNPVVRICPECRGPLSPRLIRSAIYCGKRCRDTAWRRKRAA